MERKLVAILAADVVGYSLLMEMDEAGTFERMKGCREELPRRVTDGFDQVRIAL